MKTILCILAMTWAALATAAEPVSAALSRGGNGYWVDSERGWFWYEDPVEEPAEKPAPKPRVLPAKAAPRAKPQELMELEALRRRVEDLRGIAVMNPTEANVRRYMELEQVVVQRASLFADVAQRIAWASPELDNTTSGRPVNAKALEVWNAEQSQSRARTLGDLSKTHVLFFFFRGDCNFCHAYSPILLEFARKYGLQIVPVSLDGGALPEFGAPRADNGIAATLKVNQVPATFLAEPFTGKITPIGFGVLAESQLLERVSMLANPTSQALVPGVSRYIPLQ
jgi:conjugal transfer pilus assembly protein TraF